MSYQQAGGSAPTQVQAARLLYSRRQAAHDLVEYARYVDIPSVPLDASEDKWEIVDTPLAAHHVLVLRVLQAMVDGTLTFDPQTMSPSWGSGLPPVGVAPVGGSPNIAISPLSEPPKSESYGTIPPQDDNSLGGRPCDSVPNSSKTARTHRSTATQAGSTNSGDLMPSAPLLGTDTGRSESLLPNLPEPTRSGLTRMQSGESGDLAGTKLSGSGLRECTRINEVCRRVMIMMPPGAAKSTYASVVFPSWQMGRVDDQEIILSGWGDPICRRHGKRTRQICASPQYHSVFGTGLDAGTKAAENWALENGSSYKSSGVQSGCAGFRADGLVWDDLTKNRKEADSKTIRDDVYNAYIDDLRSRKKPDAWEVGIGTRWHEDEIMGRILPDGYAGESGFMRCRDGNVWYVICLAAQCERDDDPLGREVGEYIWPEWFGENYWGEKKAVPRSWGSLYQQRPAPEEGIYFKDEWFRTYDELPAGDYYIGFDPAVTEAEDRDETAILVFLVDQHGKLYLVDEWVSRVTMDIWIGQLLKKGQQYKPLEMISESGVIRRASEPFIKRAMLNMKAFFRFEYVHRHADKSAMARAAQGMMSAGNVYLPKNEVGQRFKDECLRFPAGKDDHRVDAFANLCLRLEVLWEATPPKQIEEKSAIIGAFGGEELKVKSFMPPRFSKKRSRWKLSQRR